MICFLDLLKWMELEFFKKLWGTKIPHFFILNITLYYTSTETTLVSPISLFIVTP